MAGIERFEDIFAWQKARELTKSIYIVTQQGALGKDFGLSRQMQRAAVSIMSNIAEGFERNGHGEFHQFLSIAKASCAEVRSLLYVAFDAEYIDQHIFDRLLASADEVGRVTGGLCASIEQRRHTER